MKILLLSHKFYPDLGGIEVNSEMLANAFSKAGHELKIITWTKEPGEKKFPYFIIRNPNPLVLMKEHIWADIIFENNPCLRLGWPAFFLNRPTVVALCTWINSGESIKNLSDRLKMFCLKRAVAVIAVSDAVRKKCWPASTVISNPYRHELFRILPHSTKSEDFVFLGRLVSDKGADIAIKALHKLKNETKDFSATKYSLTIIGEGPELETLKRLAIDLEIQQQVRFAGLLKGEALVNCLNQHKYMLVPSTWEEPFGNVALEGMACGCLPIVSNGGGLPDAIGLAGLTFNRGDVDSLVKCIKDLLNNPAKEQQLRDASTQHLASHHLDIIANKYLELMENTR